MENLVTWIKLLTSWLYVRVYENPVFFIDYWSFVHFWSGFVVFALLFVVKLRPAWRWLAFFLFCYECLELLLLYIACDVFRPETLKDQFTDVFVGLLGGFFCQWLLKRRSAKGPARRPWLEAEAVLTSLTIAFVWTGNYTSFFAHPTGPVPFDLKLFLGWALAGWMLLMAYRQVRQRKSWERLKLPRPAFWWLLLPVALFLIWNEAAAKLRTSDFPSAAISAPGRMVTRVFVLCFPFLQIAAYQLACHLFKKAQTRFP